MKPSVVKARIKASLSKVFRSYFFPFDYQGNPSSVGVLVVTPKLVFSWLLCQISRALDDRLLEVDWLVKPLESETLTRTTRGDLTEMAIGQRQSDGSLLQASRILKRSNKDLRGIGIYWQLDFEDTHTTGFINLGEDPRIFEFRGELWIHYQIRIQDLDDCETYIFNARENITLQLRVNEKSQGKNWTAFEYQNDLYFVYSFDPFNLYKASLSDHHQYSPILLSSVDLKVKKTNSFTRSDQVKTGIGAIRGGTPLVEVQSGLFVGFTHVNLGDKFEKSHHMGFIELDLINRSVTHKGVTKSRLNLLTAPYSLEHLQEGKIAVNYNCSAGSVHNLHQPITNKKSTFSLKDLRK